MFALRLLQLRKERGWSQPELAKKIGTSGQIVGRYERGDMTPSIEVAKKLADALDVTLDFLSGGSELPEAFRDKKMIERWAAVEELPEKEREAISLLIDSVIAKQKLRAMVA